MRRSTRPTPPSCKFCGCTDRRACPGGCSWWGNLDLMERWQARSSTRKRWALDGATGVGGRPNVCSACAELAVDLGFVLLRFLRDDRDTMIDRWRSLQLALKLEATRAGGRKATRERRGSKPAKPREGRRGARK